MKKNKCVSEYHPKLPTSKHVQLCKCGENTHKEPQLRLLQLIPYKAFHTCGRFVYLQTISNVLRGYDVQKLEDNCKRYQSTQRSVLENSGPVDFKWSRTRVRLTDAMMSDQAMMVWNLLLASKKVGFQEMMHLILRLFQHSLTICCM